MDLHLWILTCRAWAEFPYSCLFWYRLDSRYWRVFSSIGCGLLASDSTDRSCTCPLIFLLGLYDNIHSLGRYTKFAVQHVAAAL
jgi:hypothetical protein